MAIEDVIVTKVMSLTEHSADYGTLIEMARALREQIDWEAVRRRTSDSPFSAPYFVLLDQFGIVPAERSGGGAGDADHARVRVAVSTFGEGRS